MRKIAIYGMVIAAVGFLLLSMPMSVLGWRNTGSYPVTLDNSNSDCKNPTMYNVDSSGGDIELVAWQQWETDHWDIYFSFGADTTWSPANPYRITNNGLWGNNNNDCTYPDICGYDEYPGDETCYTVYIAWQYEHPDYDNTWEIETCRIYITEVDQNWPGTIQTVEYASIHQQQIPGQDPSVSEWDWFDSIYPALDCGDNVYLVWEDSREGSKEIYFDWSMQGLTWHDNDELWSNSGHDSKDPCIAVDRYGEPEYDKVCAMWEDYEDYPFSQIWYRLHFNGPGNPADYGPFQVQNGGAGNNELNPDIEDFNNDFLFVWDDDRNINEEIYYGETRFGPPPPLNPAPLFWNTLRVTNNNGEDKHPAIDVCENDAGPGGSFNEIHICWDSSRSGTRDIYACRGVQNPGSTSDSLSCSGQGGSDDQVSFSNSVENYPDISCHSNEGYCVWQRDQNPWEIRYTKDP